MEKIHTTLRDARQNKGLSQSELGALVGLPQSHISKIEKGGTDIKLSSLVQLARALDLELQLVPKRALPAVESVVRSVSGFPRDRTQPAQAQIERTKRVLNQLESLSLSPKIHEQIERVSNATKTLNNLKIDTDAFVRIRNLTEQLQNLSTSLPKLDAYAPSPEVLNRLKTLERQFTQIRNNAVHVPNTSQAVQRPAYRLEEDADE